MLQFIRYRFWAWRFSRLVCRRLWHTFTNSSTWQEVDLRGRTLYVCRVTGEVLTQRDGKPGSSVPMPCLARLRIRRAARGSQLQHLSCGR